MSSIWFGLMLLVSSPTILASSVAEDAGPMPPPEGPFFSSKPLLYFGEEPSTTEVKGIQIQGISPPQRARSPFGMARDYPGYYGPAPLGAGRKMMQRQVPTYLPGWGNRPPYYRYNPGNSGYPPFPARWGANPQ